MDTYLWVCGIILNIVILLVIIISIADEIYTRRQNKKKALEKAKQDALYREELRTAKPAWQDWAQKLADLHKARANETDRTKRFRIEMDMITLQNGGNAKYYFDSIKKSLYFRNLAEENGWTLQEESAKSA